MGSVTQRLMRRSNPAFEDAGYDDTSNEISDEVEILSVVEDATDDVVEIDQINGAVAEMEEIEETLTDTVDYIDENIDEATENDVAMTEQVIDMADEAVGTGSAEEVLPNSESYINSRINTEGIKDVIRQIWEKIKAAIKSLWNKVKSFYRKIFGAWGSVERAATKLRDDAKALNRKAPSKDKDKDKLKIDATMMSRLSHSHASFKINEYSDISSLVNSQLTQLTKLVDLTAEVKTFETMTDNINDLDLDKMYASQGKGSNSILGLRVDMEKTIQPVVDKVTAIAKGKGKSLPKHLSDDDAETNGGFEVQGNKIYYWNYYKTTNSGKEGPAFTKIKYALGGYTDKEWDPDEKEIKVPSIQNVESFADDLIDHAKQIRKHLEGKSFEKAEKAKDKLVAAGDKLQTQIDKFAEDDDRGDTNKKHTINKATGLRRAVTNFNSMITAPTQLANHMVSVVNAAMAVSRKVFSHYK